MSWPEFEVEPNWKELAQRYKQERDLARKELKAALREVGRLSKQLGDTTLDEEPCFLALPGPK